MKMVKSFLIAMLTLLSFWSFDALVVTTPVFAELPQKNTEMGFQTDTTLLSGKVVETMDSGGYTYVKIEKDGKKTWVAVPAMKVSVGQDLSFQPGIPMNNYTSKTLNRTFETIIFSGGAAGQHGKTGSYGNSAEMKTAEAAGNIKVSKASGPNAYTVEELYEKSTELDRKEVVVRGQVVKVSPQIMGKNWIHVQDGSGDPSKGTNDITATSQDLPAVGDTITVEGTLYKDKDFGSGYKYSAIVENANIKK